MARLGTVGLMTLAIVASLFVFGCERGEWDGDYEKWEDIPNPGGDGPEVLFKPNAEPVPLIPFPCDIMAKADHRTPSGMRVHVPEDASTDMVHRTRKSLNELDGFTTFGMMSISFSAPLDLESISNDTVFVIDVDKDSPSFGEIVALDFGDGYLPIALESPRSLYPFDPFGDSDNYLFPPDNRVQYYEDSTNTMIIRPVVPLWPSTKYAVVLTRELVGEDGEPIRPPDWFDSVTFPGQEKYVWRAAEILKERMGIEPDEIGFAWVFTTQTTYWVLEEIRRGLHGAGPFAQLESEFPPKITVIDPFSIEIEKDGDMYRFDADLLDTVIGLLAPLVAPDDGVPWAEYLKMDQLDYWVMGTYTTPLFLTGEDRVFTVRPDKNIAYYDREEVPFFIGIPKPTEANNYAQPPYPVMVYLHANLRNRLDILILANTMATQGIATIGIDAAEHGPEAYIEGFKIVLDGIVASGGEMAEAVGLICKLLIFIMYPSIDTSGMNAQEVVQQLWDTPLFYSLMKGRSWDHNGDGFLDSGRSFFVADVRRSRDICRQTVVDLFQLTRILKHLGYDFNNNGRIDREEGDFNQDGILDMGGPDNEVYFSSMSLGSLMGPAFVALEPEVRSAVFNVAGGGLVDILTRTSLSHAIYPIGLELVGPVIVGRPDPDDPAHALLTYNRYELDYAFDSILSQPGFKVVLRNLRNDEEDQAAVNEEGGFALAVPTDEGDLLELSVYDSSGELYDRKRWPSKLRGFGAKRNTPEARYFLQIAQWLIDPADSVNYAPFFRIRPRPNNPKKNVLIQICEGDSTVPIASGISLARAAGFVSADRSRRLIDLGTNLGEKTDSFRAVNCPLESKFYFGWRIHPGYNHEYFLAPRDKPNSIMYCFVAKNQMALFLKENGKVIVDKPTALVPPKYLWEGDEQCEDDWPF